MFVTIYSERRRKEIEKAMEDRREYEKRFEKEKAKFKGMRRIDFLGEGVSNVFPSPIPDPDPIVPVHLLGT
jgi:hypothetical protein